MNPYPALTIVPIAEICPCVDKKKLIIEDNAVPNKTRSKRSVAECFATFLRYYFMTVYYAVGAMYGYLRRSFIAPDNYAFATDMYNDYIYRELRHSAMGSIMGYGIREVPKHSTLRQNLAVLFPDIQVDTAT